MSYEIQTISIQELVMMMMMSSTTMVYLAFQTSQAYEIYHYLTSSSSESCLRSGRTMSSSYRHVWWDLIRFQRDNKMLFNIIKSSGFIYMSIIWLLCGEGNIFFEPRTVDELVGGSRQKRLLDQRIVRSIYKRGKKRLKVSRRKLVRRTVQIGENKM